MIIWTTSTGDAGCADTRTLAATEATDAVLAHWDRHHPHPDTATGVTICVDDAAVYVGPGIDGDGVYDTAASTDLLHQMRDYLAAALPEHETTAQR